MSLIPQQHDDPFHQFRLWYADAQQAGEKLPHAMSLATATKDGRPSARMVLMSYFDHNGFVFHTNYESRKGRELAHNPYAALVFYWRRLGRQVRIEGKVSKVSAEASDTYFARRPRAAQLGARASHQSRPLKKLQDLRRAYHQQERELERAPVPRPAYWGGYRVRPDEFEFWISKPDRLHVRWVYRPLATDTTSRFWSKQWLYP